jgi:hypothetical protein
LKKILEHSEPPGYQQKQPFTLVVDAFHFAAAEPVQHADKTAGAEQSGRSEGKFSERQNKPMLPAMIENVKRKFIRAPQAGHRPTLHQ